MLPLDLRTQRQLSPLRHDIERIVTQVHEDLLQLIPTNIDQSRFGGPQIMPQLHLFAPDSGLYHTQHPVEDRVQGFGALDLP